MKKKYFPVLYLLFLLSPSLFAGDFSISKIEPPNWWKGMKWDTLQVMVYGENLNDISLTTNSNELQVLNVHEVKNNTYLFVDLVVEENIESGTYELTFSSNGKVVKYNYTISEREFAPESHLGFTNEDVVYLIFVDRFNNGDPTNDTLKTSLDEFKYKELNGRWGGDLQGIIDKLDYLKELGITAIWLTPTLENKMYMSYHGYASTNLYKIDERFGSNELYKELVAKAKEKEIKVIYDHVANHIGINHEWVSNLPEPDWINGTVENHLPTNHDKPSIIDIYSNEESRSFNEKGWFTDYMIDMNQANPFLANYLIQNMLWWIEYAGIDGIREDTYPYANQKFMSVWAKKILNEYPNMNIVGEIWTGEPAYLAGFQKDSKVRENFETNLPSILDFGLRDAFADYLSGKSIYEIYKTLAKDYLYSYPSNLMPFVDNHDMDRAMFIAKGDSARFKIALTILLTTRGIPQIFYGTEIGMDGGGHHGKIRQAFPGGFTGDERNAFTKEGRTKLENEIYDYLKKLLSLRKDYSALSTGKLLHFVPYSETYVYFKESLNQKLMIAINNNETEFEVKLDRMKKELGKTSSLLDLMNNEEVHLNEHGNILLPAKTARIYLLN